MSGPGWKHNGKTYDSPNAVIDELQGALDQSTKAWAKAADDRDKANCELKAALLQKRELEGAVTRLSIQYQKENLPLPPRMIEAWANINAVLAKNPPESVKDLIRGAAKPKGAGDADKGIGGQGALCDRQYSATEDTYGHCGRSLGHEGDCGMND